MLRRRIAAGLACALLLAAPSAALGQGSAGDQQYQDPLPPSDTGGGSGSSGGSSGSSGGGSTPAPAPAPAPATGSGTAPGTAAPGTSTPTTVATEGSATPPGELPRTGPETLLIAAFGAAFLLTGTGLRMVVPQREH